MRTLGARLIAVVVMTAALASAGAAPPVPKGARRIEPFDYRGVTLEGGPLKAQVDDVRRFYLAIPDDDLLKGFRGRAGKPAPGHDLGGWYSSDTFLVFGQIVSGLARLHAGTGDAACRDKANRLVAEWAKCIEPDGYFYASRKPNAPHYIYDKILWGLLDCAVYCENKEALIHLGRITDWAIRNLERSRKVNDTSTEWYTLSENLYRAYLATGDPKYRDFAAVWEYHDYWGLYERGASIFDARPDGSRSTAYHAYSHVNTLGGAGAAYRVTGQWRYLDTLRNAFDYLQRNECYATGGFGPDEQLLPRPAFNERLGQTHNTFETQCGCWAAFKMAKYLLTFTGDARYGDWVERLALNGLAATIPMTRDGRVFYYSDYNLHGGTKRNTDFGWSCCTGTRPQAVADLHDLVYFHDADSLYVNLFAPSSVQWERPGGPVLVRQETDFPKSEVVRFTITPRQATEFALKFRVPGWLAGPIQAAVNDGPSVELRADDRHWATIRRTWRRGDWIALRLPMRLWASPLEAGRATPAAVLFGPTVLAFQAPSARAVRKVDTAHLDRVLSPVAWAPWRFGLASDPAVTAGPFAKLKAGERYFMYIDPAMGAQIPHMDVAFTGQWHDAGVFRFSSEVGATAGCEFEGTGVRWLGRRFDDAGTAEIAIDGAVVARVDQYGPGRDLPFDWARRGLPAGRHTIRLRLLPEKPAASRDRFLNVAGFEVLDGPG
jgi:uncharacterized protein